MKKYHLPSIPVGLAILASSNIVMADEFDNLFSTKFERITTSNQQSRNTASMLYQGKNVAVQVDRHNLKNQGRRYNATKAMVHGRASLTDNVQIGAGVGAIRVERHGGGKRKNITPYNVGVQASFGKFLKIELKHNRSAAFEEFAVDNSRGDVLTHRTNSIAIEARPSDRVRLEARHQRSKLSDGNTAKRSAVGAYYGISANVWAGIEATQLAFDREEDGYWTPKKQRTVAAVMTASAPITERLSVNGTLGVGRAKEQGIDQSTRHVYASLGADFQLNKQTSIGISANHTNSSQNGEKWRENGAMITLSRRW